MKHNIQIYHKIFSFILLSWMLCLILAGCHVNNAENPMKDSSSTEIAENSTFHARFLDVGQGDAILIECDQHYLLIDGGSAANSDKIYAILKEADITHFDLVVATHPDEDHVAGLAGAFQYATATVTLCSSFEGSSKGFDDFLKYAKKNSEKLLIPKTGDSYPLGSATVTVLGIHSGPQNNDSSIILKIQYGQTSFLFTGDAEALAEQALIQGGSNLSATVLKVSHHGSSDSSSDAFLKQVNPKYAIISVGKENPYFHPSKTVLRRLDGLNAKIYRTDLQGEISVISDGKEVFVTTEKTASKEQLLTSGKEAAEEKPTVPDETDYVLNKNTYKIHKPNCKNIYQMKETNKIYYQGSKEDLLKEGYEPCGYCKP